MTEPQTGGAVDAERRAASIAKLARHLGVPPDLTDLDPTSAHTWADRVTGQTAEQFRQLGTLRMQPANV